MSRVKRRISKTYLAALAIILVASLVASAVIGKKCGNDGKNGSSTPSSNTVEPTNTVEPGNDVPSNAADNTVPSNSTNTANNTNNTNNTNNSNSSKNTNTKNNTDNTKNADATPAKPVDNIPGGLTPKEYAAGMQDYTVDPKTGQAKEIKVVDDNYLLLVNRSHALAEDYAPDDMVTVKYIVSGIGKKGETDKLRKVAAEAFEMMVEAAAEQEINIKMRTGYRSYAYQRDRLYNQYVKNYGKEYADTISARPGQSEHQTGLALDVGGETEKYALSREFGNTKEGKWVAEHCHEYGFIIRYTDGTKDAPGETTGFISEPWHLRYVGVQAAKEIHASGQLLEEYLGVLN